MRINRAVNIYLRLSQNKRAPRNAAPARPKNSWGIRNTRRIVISALFEASTWHLHTPIPSNFRRPLSVWHRGRSYFSNPVKNVCCPLLRNITLHTFYFYKFSLRIVLSRRWYIKKMIKKYRYNTISIILIIPKVYTIIVNDSSRASLTFNLISNR